MFVRASGMPNSSMAKQPPCLVGGCYGCDVQGLYKSKRTLIPGACRALPAAHGIRRKYAAAFGMSDETTAWKELATLTRPKKRTKAAALANGRAFLRGEICQKEASFLGVDVFSEMLAYHDKTRHNHSDTAHQYANAIKQTVTYLLGRKGEDKKLFNTAMRVLETEVLLRFPLLRKPL